MSEFDFLSACEVSEASTAQFPLPHLAGRPVLTLAPMTKENLAFLREALKNPVRPASASATPDEQAAKLRAINTRNAEAMIKTGIIRGWSNMLRPDGTEIPFTAQNAADFLRRLADKAGWILEEVVTFAGNPANFIQTIATEETAKNSVGG